MVKDRTYVDIIFTARNVCISNGSYISMELRYHTVDETDYHLGRLLRST